MRGERKRGVQPIRIEEVHVVPPKKSPVFMRKREVKTG
jgi:hypothetical protein